MSFFYSRQLESQSKTCDTYTKLFVYGRMVDRTFLRAIFSEEKLKSNQTVNHNLNIERNQWLKIICCYDIYVCYIHLFCWLIDYVYRVYRNKVTYTIDDIFRTSFVINFVVNVWRKYLVALYEFISYQSKIISLQCSDCMNNI